jgi:hypothetical protein
MDFVNLRLFGIAAIFLPLVVGEIIYYIRTGNKDEKAFSYAFDFLLNGFRTIFYPFMLFLIIKGLRTTPPIYSEPMTKMVLVPAEYIASLPLLALEGLAGIRYFVKEILYWLFIVTGRESRDRSYGRFKRYY